MLFMDNEMEEQITVFRRFPFETGQKLNISDEPRKGDWEVIGVDEKHVKLRCPVSGFIAQWDRFCYFVEEKNAAWPSPED